MLAFAFPFFTVGGKQFTAQVALKAKPGSLCPCTPSSKCVRPLLACVAAGTDINTTSVSPPTTDQTFAIDAGRDLFFTGMDADIALTLISAPLGTLPQREDRFIAAERLKFYPSAKATETILDFIARFERSRLDDYILEDRVARRKAVETLGRYKGAFLKDRVFECLQQCLNDPDPYMIEVAVWALAEIGHDGADHLLPQVAAVLQNESVAKRVVIQSLMRAGYTPALEHIQHCVHASDPSTASAAWTAMCVLGGDRSMMHQVVNVLKSENLSARRCALEDISLSKHTSALPDVIIAPNSLVLRARTARVLLEELNKMQENVDTMDDRTAALIDRLLWDFPAWLDLLGKVKDTQKARDLTRNIRQLYKNDALGSYLAARTIVEDYRNDPDAAAAAGEAILSSFTEKPYFDYFGAYHIFRTLGWLRYQPAVPVLLDNAQNLPPRFFNHQAGAILALAEIGDTSVYPVLEKVAFNTSIWELKYACLIAAEILSATGHIVGQSLRTVLQDDKDWIIRARARCTLSFDHLRSD